MNLKEENEKLRDLLRRVYNYVPIPDQIRIDSALSQQDCNEVDPEPTPAVDALSFVQPVPDHCDRIVWRERYYHLPLEAKAEPAPCKVAQQTNKM